VFSELYSTLSFTFFSSFLVEKNILSLIFLSKYKIESQRGNPAFARASKLPIYIFYFLLPLFYFAGIKIHAGNAADQENNLYYGIPIFQL